MTFGEILALTALGILLAALIHFAINGYYAQRLRTTKCPKCGQSRPGKFCPRCGFDKL